MDENKDPNQVDLEASPSTDSERASEKQAHSEETASQAVTEHESELEAPISTTQQDNLKNVPELYSKRLILIFSLIFSSVLGVIFLMMNMKKTGNSKGQMQVLIFGIIYMFLYIFLPIFLLLVIASSLLGVPITNFQELTVVMMLSLLGGPYMFIILIIGGYIVQSILNLLGAAILNIYFWNKFIGEDFKYQKRGWLKPAIICAVISVLSEGVFLGLDFISKPLLQNILNQVDL